jgi:cell shape-determining protein MreC
MPLAFSPKRSLVLALVITAVIAFIPARHLAFLNWFGRLTLTLVAPISHPLASVSRWLAPSGGMGNVSDSDPQIRTLSARVDEAETALLRARRENDRLRDLLAQSRVLLELNPAPATHLEASVYGASSDLSSPILRVRAGASQGVNTATVAVVRGEQLLGKVVNVTDNACVVLPITAKAAGTLKGQVLVERSSTPADGPRYLGLACTLEQMADGTFRGPVEDRRDPGSPLGIPQDRPADQGPSRVIEPALGQIVRLDDPDRWPAQAQMLVIGRIERIDPSPGQPLRKIITVRPIIDQMERSQRIGLRIPGAVDSTPPPKAGGS